MLTVLPLCALAACYGGDDSSDARATPAAEAVTEIYPVGVVVARDAKSTIRGIYAAAGSGDAQSCCWVGPDARFRVYADPDVKSIQLTVYEPAIGNLAASQKVTLLDGKGKPFSSHRVVPGLQTFSLAVPRSVVNYGAVAVRLHMSNAIVPKDIGMNTDPRKLSIILRAVSAE
jgi:hypothetical protein